MICLNNKFQWELKNCNKYWTRRWINYTVVLSNMSIVYIFLKTSSVIQNILKTTRSMQGFMSLSNNLWVRKRLCCKVGNQVLSLIWIKVDHD